MFSSLTPSFLLIIFILFPSLPLDLGLGLGLGFPPLPIENSQTTLLGFWANHGSAVKRTCRFRRIEIGGFGSVFSSGGFSIPSLEFSLKYMAPIRRNRKEGTAQIGEPSVSGHADRLIQGTIDHGSGQISMKLGSSDVNNNSSSEHMNPCFSGKFDKEQDPLVLNVPASLSSSERNPSPHPWKVLEQVQYEEASAAVSTTGPVGESEAMRRWKEMKQNGFLSNPHGGMPTQPPEPVKKKRGKRPAGLTHSPGGMPGPPPQHGNGSSFVSHSPAVMPMPPLQHGKGSSCLAQAPGVSDPPRGMPMPPLLPVKESSLLSHPPGGTPMPPSLQGKESSLLAHPHGAMLTPSSQPGKLHDGKQSKRKEVDPKRNTETTKREQADKFKSAPPSGLLSGLNIGIIRRIRNQKEVCAIMEARVRPEKTDAQIQNKFVLQVESGSEEDEGAAEFQNQSTQSANGASILPGSEKRGKRIVSDSAIERSCAQIATSPGFSIYDKKMPSGIVPSSDVASRACGDDFSAEQAPSLLPRSVQTIKLLASSDAEERFLTESVNSSKCVLDQNNKLPLAITAPSEIATKACSSDFSMEQEMFVLTKKGAAYAFQWLEVLHKDIKGRLAMLRCNKERVTVVIHKRLPVLASSELHHPEAGPMFWRNSGTRCFARWMSIFSKFHSKLCEDEKLLEKKSREIQDLLLHCEIGLKFVNRDEFPQGQQFGSEQFRTYMEPDDLASQRAVRAAAATLYFTCSLVLEKRVAKYS